MELHIVVSIFVPKCTEGYNGLFTEKTILFQGSRGGPTFSSGGGGGPASSRGEGGPNTYFYRTQYSL